MLHFNFEPFPILSTKRLILRRLAETDARDLFALRSDKNVMQYIGRPLAKSVDEMLDLIRLIDDQLQTGNGIMWTVALQNDPKLIGTICYWNVQKENDRAEIGYLLNPEFQRQGIMQEALAAVVDYGFGPMKLHSIEAHVDPGNRASLKLLERNGFVREAYFKENHYYDGKFLDTVVCSRLAPVVF